MPYSNELLVKYTAIINLFWISYSETTDFSVEVGGGKIIYAVLVSAASLVSVFFQLKNKRVEENVPYMNN